MRIWIVVALCAALGGCASGARLPGEGELFMNQSQIAAKDDAICQGYGAKPGTPEYINCRGQQDQRRTIVRAAPD
jgi:hypothetical protein